MAYSRALCSIEATDLCIGICRGVLAATHASSATFPVLSNRLRAAYRKSLRVQAFSDVEFVNVPHAYLSPGRRSMVARICSAALQSVL